LDPEFRSWLTQRMVQERFHKSKIDGQIDRFEIVCGYLSHEDQRCLDFQAISEDSGYADHLLRDSTRRIGERFGLVEKRLDHEGTWYSLKADPFSPPVPEVEVEQVKDQGESSMERLYRECCDDANRGVRDVVLKLEAMRRQVEPAVGALVMDAQADLSQISILLTKISATGVKENREDYIGELREKIQEILKG
jgi:hypothetical protein